jgi:hypothetical protein
MGSMIYKFCLKIMNNFHSNKHDATTVLFWRCAVLTPFWNHYVCSPGQEVFQLMEKTVTSVKSMSNSLLNLCFCLMERGIESHIASNPPQIKLGLSFYGHFYVPPPPLWDCISL